MINRILTAGILTLSFLAPVATSAAVPPPVSKEASRLQALRNARVGIGGVRVMRPLSRRATGLYVVFESPLIFGSGSTVICVLF
jgi:hypothetical protein